MSISLPSTTPTPAAPDTAAQPGLVQLRALRAALRVEAEHVAYWVRLLDTYHTAAQGTGGAPAVSLLALTRALVATSGRHRRGIITNLCPKLPPRPSVGEIITAAKAAYPGRSPQMLVAILHQLHDYLAAVRSRLDEVTRELVGHYTHSPTAVFDLSVQVPSPPQARR